MASITLRNGKTVGDYLKPYIVAEINTSHFGDIGIAKDMIKTAKSSGCDCVKFQSWSSETLYAESYYKDNRLAKKIFTKFSLSSDQLKLLSDYSLGKGIDFTSTPYSIDEALFLVRQCEVPFIKIASMELNNIPYLVQLGKLGVPLVLSTGMGTMEEIKEAVKSIRSVGCAQLIILHCTSLYPADPQLIRLNNIQGLRNEFPEYPIGYSDHSLGVEIPIASIALGACMIEKHFTLDSSRIGLDNQMATEPNVFTSMVRGCNIVYEAMGGIERMLSEEENSQSVKMRRSMVSKIQLKPGDEINYDSIEFKRPGIGISPAEAYLYIGRKVNKFIDFGSLIFQKDLE
jgi:sialic acid synthase SpsE